MNVYSEPHLFQRLINAKPPGCISGKYIIWQEDTESVPDVSGNVVKHRSEGDVSDNDRKECCSNNLINYYIYSLPTLFDKRVW